ncbi:MarR family winged helix-turn-helix transcriptional regulator [Microlunatus capsulatus]|uniref:DNA-binding MarR family transcriptional regulator n=1 Tax=Microlunatus capsulatus TaxID=99117 RepID=A0ABS4Z306_9ACTN|nr:MarR family transcriptional regulator [Microlunatus capsulatus]MBP2415115.1 DNA-binding MarR family transcriptional regulator [Microlunatus capsulatus]
MQTPPVVADPSDDVLADTATQDAPAGRLRLDDQLCFALYAATNEIVRVYRPLLAELGLTYPQYLLMMALWEQDDQPVTALARTLHLPAHGVLPVLTRLAEAGLVSRRPDPVDRRVTRVTLTPAGAALEGSAAAAQRVVASRTRLAPDAFRELRSGLHELSAVLRG